MAGTPNKKNSNFQTLHYIVGSCHTPDAAYARLCSQREERETAVANVLSEDYKTQAKIIRANRQLASEDEAEQLDGKATLAEIDAFKPLVQRNIDAAQDELNFINSLIEKIQPLRKYSHLSDIDAHEAAQEEEWYFELVNRAENHLLMDGRIPTAEFKTMRMHPQFNAIRSQIHDVQVLLKNGDTVGLDKILDRKPDTGLQLLYDEVKQLE